MLKPIKFIKFDTHINFLSKIATFLTISIMIVILSIGTVFFKGLNFGIDFNGGTIIEVQKIIGNADVSEMRERLSSLDIGNTQLQEFGKNLIC